jgi:hypothetical protein
LTTPPAALACFINDLEVGKIETTVNTPRKATAAIKSRKQNVLIIDEIPFSAF